MENSAKKQLSTLFWIVVIFAALPASPARAQDGSRVDVSAGYSSLRDYDGGPTFLRGWFGSVGADVAGTRHSSV